MRILIADDHRIVREGLRSLLDDQSDLEVVAEADNGRDAVRLVGEVKPDVVVMDVGMPQLNGVEATRRVMRDHPGTKVIALSMHSEPQFVSSMLAAGASAYLLKNTAARELVHALRAVLKGERYLSAKAAAAAQSSDLTPGTAVLSDREREVLRLLAEGKSSKEIADVLSLSPRTVEQYRVQIMDKLNIRTVAGLTKYAVLHGLTAIP